MRVTIHPGCMGCGICERNCPEVFMLDDRGRSQLVRQPEENELPLIKAISESCPGVVIELSQW